MLFKLIFTSIIFILISGCSSVPVYQVIPVTTGNVPHVERTIISVEDGDAKTILNFDAQAGDYFSFFVVIENKSDSEVTVYPEEFYSEAYLSSDSLETEVPHQLFAYNPEYQLETIDKEMSSLNSSKNINDGLNCFLLGVVVAGDIADIGSNTTEEEEIAEEEFKNMVFEKIGQDQIEYENSMFELEKEREHWQYEAFRIATLKPGEKIAGVFYLPIYDRAKWLKVIIPVGAKEYVYNYKQVRIE